MGHHCILIRKLDMVKNIWAYRYEWRTKTVFLGLPLVHIAIGRDRETGRLLMAKGIIAIGQFSIGIIAIGQFAAGVFAFAQFAAGIALGIGQFSTGIISFGQYAWSF